jgi:hypothetical protein
MGMRYAFGLYLPSSWPPSFPPFYNNIHTWSCNIYSSFILNAILRKDLPCVTLICSCALADVLAKSEEEWDTTVRFVEKTLPLIYSKSVFPRSLRSAKTRDSTVSCCVRVSGCEDVHGANNGAKDNLRGLELGVTIRTRRSVTIAR